MLQNVKNVVKYFIIKARKKRGSANVCEELASISGKIFIPIPDKKTVWSGMDQNKQRQMNPEPYRNSGQVSA